MWDVKLHPDVLDKDLPEIDAGDRRKILKAIQKKLTSNPEEFGERLRGDLFGYGKLLVGQYRVVYRMVQNKLEILVIQIGIRRDFEVYDSLLKRLSKDVH